jgi:hypothetical protein
MKTLLTTLTLFSLALSPLARAHDPHATQEMVAAANNLLSALSPEQKAKATFQFTDEERKNWHFIPRPRKGLPVKEMTPAQRLLAYALLATGLSSGGYEKATTIMSLEEILATLEKDRKGGPVRDPELYFVSIFGDPGLDKVWGWRVEGHHLSFNFVAAGENVASMTPSFFGTNPAEVREGQRKGLRVLGTEEDLGWKLVRSLNDEQKKQAVVLTEAPKDIINVPGRNDTKPEGVPYSKLNPDQQKTLDQIIHVFLFRNRPGFASESYDKIKAAGLDKVDFAWAGGTEAGQGHYYRVQGPTFVLEFDNTQNDANHAHTAWRDFENDFGADPLLQHYRDAHGTK